MSNNLDDVGESYSWLKKINLQKFDDKSFLIIGAGWMGKQYAKALHEMNVNDVTIISKNDEKATLLGKEFGYTAIGGGYEKNLEEMKKMDLVIITTPVHLLIPVTEYAVKNGQNNILIEKPGSLYPQKLLELSKKSSEPKIRIAYNRLVYPNFHLLKYLVKKEGGILSCFFSFTEWIHTINFQNNISEVYNRWGIANSLHVISMVEDLIGNPKEFSSNQLGKLDWHPSGSIFVGSGITDKEIPFSYHSNWESSGRWGIEIMTKENAYRLIPLEELHVCQKGTTEWKKVSFEKAFSEVKEGVAEEIAVMLSKNLPKELELPNLEKAAELNRLAEKIFGYNS